MTSSPPSAARRIFGVMLIVIGLFLLIALPFGFYYLDALACGMGTTGCQNYRFPWKEALMILAIPMAVAAAIVWAGFRLRRPRG